MLMRTSHGPLDFLQLWGIFAIAVVALLALLLLAATALR
jgi:hypothetical protein